MCLKICKFVCLRLQNNNVRAWNDRMLIILKNVARDHTSVIFWNRALSLHLLLALVCNTSSHLDNLKISKRNYKLFYPDPSSLAMPTYLHYKIAIGRKNQLNYARCRVYRAHKFDSAHVKCGPNQMLHFLIRSFSNRYLIRRMWNSTSKPGLITYENLSNCYSFGVVFPVTHWEFLRASLRHFKPLIRFCKHSRKSQFKMSNYINVQNKVSSWLFSVFLQLEKKP